MRRSGYPLVRSARLEWSALHCARSLNLGQSVLSQEPGITKQPRRGWARIRSPLERVEDNFFLWLVRGLVAETFR
jgi:hypothetical protein